MSAIVRVAPTSFHATRKASKVKSLFSWKTRRKGVEGPNWHDPELCRLHSQLAGNPLLHPFAASGSRFGNATTRRQQNTMQLNLETRIGAATSSLSTNDVNLVADLRKAIADKASSRLHYALGICHSRMAPPDWAGAAEHFQIAWQLDAQHVLSGFALACVLKQLHQLDFASEQAVRTLAALERKFRLTDAEAITFPPFTSSDCFHHAWERSAWSSNGNAKHESASKQSLLKWRLYVLLAEVTADIGYAYEAYRMQPEMTEAVLGKHLAAPAAPVRQFLGWGQRWQTPRSMPRSRDFSMRACWMPDSSRIEISL